MTIPVRKMLVSTGKHSIKCPYPMTAEYITFHNTYNDASANNEVKYMTSNDHEVSFHFAVDDIEVVQGIETNRNAWHCGDGGNGTGNRKSIGVEVCYSKSGGDRYVKAEAKAIKFIAQLLHERGWDVDRVKPHQHWSGKYCPHRVLDEGRMGQVIHAIQTELDTLKAPAPVKPVATTPTVAATSFRIKVLPKDLWYYDKPDWNAKKALVHAGEVFTVIGELTVNGSKMYKLKSGTYITASPKYVKRV